MERPHLSLQRLPVIFVGLRRFSHRNVTTRDVRDNKTLDFGVRAAFESFASKDWCEGYFRLARCSRGRFDLFVSFLAHHSISSIDKQQAMFGIQVFRAKD